MKTSAAAWLLLCGLLTACSPKAPDASCADGNAPRLRIIEPAKTDKDRPAIMLFSGGDDRDVEPLEPQARAFAARGYVAILADGRTICGGGAAPSGSTRDARTAYAWLLAHAGELRVDRRRIVLAGDRLALTTAQKADFADKPAALLLFDPVVDLVGAASLWRKPFLFGESPSRLPVEGLPPTMIFHGEAGTTVPIDAVRAFCDRAWRAARICVVHGQPGSGGAPSPSSVAMGKAMDFVDRLAITGPYFPKT